MTNDSSDEKERSRDRMRRGDRDKGTRFSSNSRDRSMDRGTRERGSNRASAANRVYVSNIPYEYRWQDLKDLFRNEIGDVQYVELFVDDKDKSRGCGIIEFSDSGSMKKCLEVMQRFEVKGRKLVVKEDSGNVRDKHGAVIKRAGGGGGGGDRDRRGGGDRYDSHQQNSSFGGSKSMNIADNNTYGLSPNFLESLRIELPLVNRVFIANLEYNVDKKKLKEVFRLAGRIQRVELQTDKDGRSRGFAIVEYDHPVEAVQAISMFHNQYLYDRQMTVRMDRNDSVKLPDGLKGVGMGLGSNGDPLKDVARNLPSAPSNTTSGAGVMGGGAVGASGTATAAGILGAMPSSAFQMASALSGLNNITPSALGGLQANLLGAAAAGDLSLANSLVTNPSQLAALASATNLAPFTSSGGGGGGVGVNNQNNPNFSSFGSGGRSGGSNKTNNPFGNYGGGGDSTAYNTISGTTNLRAAVNTNKNSSGFSRKIIVSNLPSSVNRNMLHDKFSEFGEVQHLEEKGTGAVLVMYANEWQAERAIKSLDRARIDGRTVDVRFFI